MPSGARAQASPRLLEALTSLQSAGVPLLRIALGPLQPPDLTALVADTLRCAPADAEPLAQVIGRKTGGNPLFVTQFLKSLEREGHLRFDASEARWRYRVDDIANAPIADDVIELMTRNIQRLPPKSQYALTLGRLHRQPLRSRHAGHRQRADAGAGGSRPAAGARRRPAGRGRARPHAGAGAGDGASEASDTHYAFLHDRVQQAAYALIPPERRQMVHLTVGRLLLSRTPRERLDARRFDIVQHLNLGRTLISTRQERVSVATLNLDAGRKAKSSTAHDTALELFLAGIELLDEAAWDNEHALAFALHLEAAESRYLCGQFDRRCSTSRSCWRTRARPIERARVIRLRSVQLENMARYARVDRDRARGHRAVRRLVPRRRGHQAARARATRSARSTACAASAASPSLQDLPLMTDPQVHMLASMLTDIWSAAYIIGDPTLARLISATLVRLSLQHGNVEESAYGYVTHAITVGAVRGDYAAGLRVRAPRAGGQRSASTTRAGAPRSTSSSTRT